MNTRTFVQQLSESEPGIFKPVPVWNLDSVPWHNAPIPARRHRCRTQTYCLLDDDVLERVDRCACGASSYPERHPGVWLECNSRTPSADEIRASMWRTVVHLWRLDALVTALVVIVVPWQLGWIAVPVCAWMVVWCAWGRLWLWAAPKLAEMRDGGSGALSGPQDAPPLAPLIVCPRCHWGSWNPHDAKYGYCGFCGWWTSDILLRDYYPALPDDDAESIVVPEDDAD